MKASRANIIPEQKLSHDAANPKHDQSYHFPILPWTFCNAKHSSTVWRVIFKFEFKQYW